MPALLSTHRSQSPRRQPPPLSACESSEPLSLAELMLFGPRPLVELQPARRRIAGLLPGVCSALLHAGLLVLLGLTWSYPPASRTRPFELQASTSVGDDTPRPTTSAEIEAAFPKKQLTSRAPARSVPAAPERIRLSAPQLADFDFHAAARKTGGLGAATLLTSSQLYRGPAAEFFGISAPGDRFVFLLDTSGSMNEGDRFRRAATELLNTLERLTPDQSFCVLLFSNGAQTLGRVPLSDAALVPADAHQKQRVASWLGSMVPQGWSDPRAALLRALELRPSAVFLLSDGEFKSGPPLRRMGAVTLRLARAHNPGRVPIHTIAYEDPINRHTLKSMSRTSGGSTRYVPAAR